MALSTTYLDPLPLLSPTFALQIVVFCSKHTVPVIIDAHVLKYYLQNLVRRVAYQKQLSGPKLMGVWLGEHVKICDPYLFMQPLKLATSNLVYNLGPKLAGVRARGASKKLGPPVFIFLQSLKLASSNLL